MRITWVGVPKEKRRELRKQLREQFTPSAEVLVCSDKGADQKAKAAILDSLWAFNAEFIAAHTRTGLDSGAIKALRETQGKLCEGANDLVRSMIKNIRDFVDDAIRADGRGHFLAGYDHNENDLRTESGDFFFAYRTN